jgi:hypothetical protein
VLSRLRQVPQDLGEVYEVVYAFIRRGGKLPVMARWIEGEGLCGERGLLRGDGMAG